MKLNVCVQFLSRTVRDKNWTYKLDASRSNGGRWKYGTGKYGTTNDVGKWRTKSQYWKVRDRKRGTGNAGPV